MEKNKKVTVHAYKYNGWLYRTWEFPTVYEETDDYVCVSSQGAHVITASPTNNKFYHSKITHPTIWYFFKKQWFNIIVAKKNKHFYYYINIASP
ncbi:MAG: hypothetical protein LBM72_00590, partial [Mycoplasmataceae bacterium]|nr:hypothetical protein [Mycoplasmataceae bacterium]